MGFLRIKKELVHGHVVGDILVLGGDVGLENLGILVTVAERGVICKTTYTTAGITVDIVEPKRILIVGMLRLMVVNNFRKIICKNDIEQRA